MKFENPKLEKWTQRDLRSKNERGFRRNGEYLRHGELRTALRMVRTAVTMRRQRRNHVRHSGYESASD